jgi:hypothetical protein
MENEPMTTEEIYLRCKAATERYEAVLSSAEQACREGHRRNGAVYGTCLNRAYSEDGIADAGVADSAVVAFDKAEAEVSAAFIRAKSAAFSEYSAEANEILATIATEYDAAELGK